MNETLKRSCKSIFVQIARFFLRYGVTYQDLQEVLKEAVVEAALCDLRLESSQSSSAHIAEKIGLSRRTVADIRSRENATSLETESAVPAGVMLKIWHNNPDYLDEDGRPRDLALLAHDDQVSFRKLAEDANCSLPLDRVVDSLEASGSVKVIDGKVIASARTFIMHPNDESTALYFGIAGSNLLSTLVHNTDNESVAPFFERTTWVSGINRAVFPRFSELVSETSVPFLELLDDWLTHRQTQIGDGVAPDQDHQVLGVGVYVFNRQEGTG